MSCLWYIYPCFTLHRAPYTIYKWRNKALEWGFISAHHRVPHMYHGLDGQIWLHLQFKTGTQRLTLVANTLWKDLNLRRCRHCIAGNIWDAMKVLRKSDELKYIRDFFAYDPRCYLMPLLKPVVCISLLSISNFFLTRSIQKYYSKVQRKR